DAYELPASPGNGFLRTSTTSLVRFKAAYVSGRPKAARPVRRPQSVVQQQVLPFGSEYAAPRKPLPVGVSGDASPPAPPAKPGPPGEAAGLPSPQAMPGPTGEAAGPPSPQAMPRLTGEAAGPRSAQAVPGATGEAPGPVVDPPVIDPLVAPLDDLLAGIGG